MEDSNQLQTVTVRWIDHRGFPHFFNIQSHFPDFSKIVMGDVLVVTNTINVLPDNNGPSRSPDTKAA